MNRTQLTASEVQLNGNRQAFEDVVCMITVASLPVQWDVQIMSGPSSFTLQAHTSFELGFSSHLILTLLKKSIGLLLGSSQGSSCCIPSRPYPAPTPPLPRPYPCSPAKGDSLSLLLNTVLVASFIQPPPPPSPAPILAILMIE